MPLSGYKTYITGILGVVAAILGYLNGTLDAPAAIGAVFLAIQSMNIRDAIGKAMKK